MATHGSNFPQVGVGAIVFKDQKVLLVKRSRPPSQGKWSIPGGRLELGETLQEAAEREIREETGVVIRASKPVYTFDLVDRDTAGAIQFHYVIVDLAADYISGDPVADDDALDARWVSAHELGALEVSDSTARLLRELYGFNV